MNIRNKSTREEKDLKFLSVPFFRRIIWYLILVVFFVFLTRYFIQHPKSLSILYNISLESLCLLFLMAAIKIGWMGLFTKVILTSFNIDLDFMEWFGLSAITTMGNYISPFQGGAAVRGIYLKTKKGLSYTKFLSTLTLMYVISFSTTALIGIVNIIDLWIEYSISNIFLTAFLVFCLGLPLVPIAVVKNPGIRRIIRIKNLDGIVEGWILVIQRPQKVAILILLAFLNAGTTLSIIHFSYLSIGYALSIQMSFLLGVLFLISAMIPITPAGLGIAEIILYLTSNYLSIESSVSILTAGINRSVLLITSIVLGIIFSFMLNRRTMKQSRIKGGE